MKLKELVEGGDFCVVGNSPDELGKGLGSKIDSYASVIRINNYKISEEFIQDYGEKVSAWAHSYCYDIDRREDVDTVLCPLPLNNWGVLARYHWSEMDWIKEDKYKTEYIDSGLWHRLLDYVDHPSTGMCLLWWINSYVKINKDQIYGFGFFDHGEQGTITKHYWGEGKATVHCGEQEYELFKELTKDE